MEEQSTQASIGVLSIDWQPLRKYGESTISCRCGAVYRSLNKSVTVDGQLKIVTEKPCPYCGSAEDHVRGASSDWEDQRIG